MINKIFLALEEKYGWRGWWPSAPPPKKIPEYHQSKNYKYSAAEKFEIMVGAVLTQNAAWSNVVTALINLKNIGCDSADKMLETDEKILLEAITPSGYYNQKLKKLKYLCEFLKKNPLKYLQKKTADELRADFLGIWGIGKETADSILLYVFNKPVFVVDAYTRRVLQRHGLINGKEEYDEIRTLIEKNIPRDINTYKNYHAVIVEHCKNNCKSKPICNDCALQKCLNYKLLITSYLISDF